MSLKQVETQNNAGESKQENACAIKFGEHEEVTVIGALLRNRRNIFCKDGINSTTTQIVNMLVENSSESDLQHNTNVGTGSSSMEHKSDNEIQ